MAESRSRAPRRLSALAGLTLSGLVLAGCAAGGPLAAPSGPPPMPHLAAADGSALAVSEWPATDPRAVILAVHGYGDYGPSTFTAAARFWAGQGIVTYAYDQRGFGRNISFGRWPGAAALAADGLILAAPAIWGGDELNPLYRAAAWSVAALMPERRLTGKGVVEIQASDNIAMLRALGRDPRYLRPPSAREILGLVRVADMAEAASPGVGLPSLLLLGAKDEIVPEAAARRVYARLTGPRRVIEYAEGWHMLFRDLQAERVWRDVADWSLALPREPSVISPPGCHPAARLSSPRKRGPLDATQRSPLSRG